MVAFDSELLGRPFIQDKGVLYFRNDGVLSWALRLAFVKSRPVATVLFRSLSNHPWNVKTEVVSGKSRS